MFDFEIGKVADTLVEMSGMFGKDLETTWKYYMHDLIKAQFSFVEVMEYIEKSRNKEKKSTNK